MRIAKFDNTQPITEKVSLCLKNNNTVFHIKICVIYVVDKQENPKIEEKKLLITLENCMVKVALFTGFNKAVSKTLFIWSP